MGVEVLGTCWEVASEGGVFDVGTDEPRVGDVLQPSLAVLGRSLVLVTPMLRYRERSSGKQR